MHSDTHDVFVFQTAGAKRWEVHTPDGVEDVLLEPGLSMYLPSGTPHAARAQDTVSLHVTIGINQLTWRGLVERSVRDALAAVGDEHLPAGYLEEPEAGSPRASAGRLEQLADRVREVDAAAAVEAEVRRFLTTRPPRLDRAASSTCSRSRELDDDTPLRRRPGHPCVLLPTRTAGSRCCSATARCDVPAWLRPALEEVRARPELAPARPRRAARRAEPAGAVPAPGPRRAARGRRVSAAAVSRRASAAPPRACCATSRWPGTASTVRAFLLVEHPGPVGRRRAARRPAARRPRRPRCGPRRGEPASASCWSAGPGRPGAPRRRGARVFAAYAHPAGPWLETGAVDDLRERPRPRPRGAARRPVARA